MTDSADLSAPPAPSPEAGEYRVLARKYRPQTFDDLLGQQALVRTLQNAFEQNRVHHAFVLTGVRGVGKTTTARIIAKGLNCIGPDGTGGPTLHPCGVCDNCRAITEDRHVDVLEMDAASHTGVGDIRELIENIRYRPVSARYKVYVIDEVHMLSNAAFNALLKTLEEPPEHAKFIFATTEIRKVPITVLSRCQRFDLRRIEIADLVQLFERVCTSEGVTAEAEALRMIARAADGSARDGLSILDQAVALSSGPVTAEQVADMLGLVDRTRIYDLFEHLMAGRIPDVLTGLADLHGGGADPLVIIQDLMDLTHSVTRLKAAPQVAGANDLSEVERDRGRSLAERLPVPALTRAWQILSKGIGEIQAAPVPIAAAEMVLIRLAYAADLPDPADLVRMLTDRSASTGGGQGSGEGAASQGAPAGQTGDAVPVAAGPMAEPAKLSEGPPDAPAHPAPVAPVPEPTDAVPAFVTDGPPLDGAPPDALPPDDGAPAPDGWSDGSEPEDRVDPVPVDFAGIADLAFRRGEPILAAQLVNAVHCVALEPGRLVIRPTQGTDPRIAAQLAAHLPRWTGREWRVETSEDVGAPTLRDQRAAAVAEMHAKAAEHPVVARALELFPGARIEQVLEGTGPDPAPAPVDDETDAPRRAGQANEA